ncbi:LPXTG cell wall anchor domain-containing protein [Listeria monocytogenes]|nr:LPXTG cell wall anchor domain-containing protein [Listeria monocytogenes]EJU4184879.1 LPXTG cell wall anchor domain-containing protein [Listeria monocytogenes]EKZ0248197.1 LPXTG cell wall anchor domain-containing protein [Listeria monocytogenes]EMB2358807.1 LPXTG cell wall anchor domain-containing protein [Listeria monocytogenes]
MKKVMRREKIVYKALVSFISALLLFFSLNAHVFANVNTVTVYVGDVLVWNGANTGNVPGISITGSGSDLDINVSGGTTYKGLSVSGGASSDTIHINILSGSATFQGDNISLPPGAPANGSGGRAGIYVNSSATLVISGGELKAIGVTGNDGTGHAGIATNGSMTINNTNVTATGANSTNSSPGGNGIETLGDFIVAQNGQPTINVTGGSSQQSDGGNGIFSMGKIDVKLGVVNARGNTGVNGGNGVVAADYPSGSASAPQDAVIVENSATLNAFGGTGTTGIGGDGVLTSKSIDITSGGNIAGTGGNGATEGGVGLTAASSLGSGYPANTNVNDSIHSDNGGNIHGTGGDATSSGMGGIGIATNVIANTGGAEILGEGGNGAGSGSGGDGIQAMSGNSNVITGANLSGVGGDGGVNGNGGDGIQTDQSLSVSNGARVTGTGGEGNGSGIGGTGILVGKDITATGGAAVTGTGGDNQGTGASGIGIKVAGTIQSNNSQISGTGGSGSATNAGDGINIENIQGTSPALSSQNGSVIKGIGGKGGAASGNGGNGITIGNAQISLIENGDSTITGTGGDGGSSNTTSGSGGSGMDVGPIDNTDNGTITGNGGNAGNSDQTNSGDGGDGIHSGGDINNSDGSNITGNGGNGKDGGDGIHSDGNIDNGGTSTNDAGTITGQGGESPNAGGNGIDSDGDITLGTGSASGTGGNTGGTGIRMDGDGTITGGNNTASGSPAIDSGTGIHVSDGTTSTKGDTKTPSLIIDGGSYGEVPSGSNVFNLPPKNAKGEALKQITIILEGNSTPGKKVVLTLINADGSIYPYNTSHLVIGKDGKLHIWLPKGAVIKNISSNGIKYPGKYVVTSKNNQEAYFKLKGNDIKVTPGKPSKEDPKEHKVIPTDTNSKDGRLPRTGDKESTVPTMIGSLLFLLGSYYIVRKK